MEQRLPKSATGLSPSASDYAAPGARAAGGASRSLGPAKNTTGASAWHAGCCHFEHTEAERLVVPQGGGRRLAGGVYVERTEGLTPSSEGLVSRSWLMEWEERQRKLLARHQEALQEATKACVGTLKDEMLERFDQLQQPRIRQICSVTPRPTSGQEAQMPQEKLRDSSEKFGVKDTVLSTTMRNSVMSAAGEKMRISMEEPSACEIYRAVLGTGTPTPAHGHAVGEGRRMRMSTMSKKEADVLTDAMASVAGAGRVKKGNTAFYSNDFEVLEEFWEDEDEEEKLPKNRVSVALQHIIHHPVFGSITGGAVMLYALAAGIMSDIEIKAALGGTPSPQWRWQVDLFFTLIFMLETAMRLGGEGRRFFQTKERNWNIFDLIVALIGLLDVIVVSTVSLGFLRVLRTFRAIRVLRIVRIFSFFKELRLMVASILCCLVSLTSASVLLIAVMYIFAVILLQSASELVREQEVRDEVDFILRSCFGNMLLTIYSLTQAVSGGRSWGEYANPFMEISPWYGVLFTLFVAFVIFGVLNILTGVFVESTSALASVDKELVIQEELARNQSTVNQMRRLFREMDGDQSGTLSYTELRKNLKDERVKAYFSILQMDVSEAHGLFQLLDRDESGEVSIEEFIMTCLRLKGTARSIDMATMLAENKRLHHAIKSFMMTMQDNFSEIQSMLKHLNSSAFDFLEPQPDSIGPWTPTPQ